jgi:hypothetical protein
LIVIGVHTPELSFEHDIEGVRQAINERAIDYPVVVARNPQAQGAVYVPLFAEPLERFVPLHE